MSENPQYKQLTQTQLELWLDDPATQALVKCFDWYKEDIQDQINTGSCVDSSNADLTSSNIHKRLGQIDGMVTARDLTGVLNRYSMIEPKEKEELEVA